MEIDPKTGLPKKTIGWEDIAKESQKIRVSKDKKRYGKIVTIVNGFDSEVDMKKLAKTLKSKLACGGTYKDNSIELQGDHQEKVKELLVKEGFDEDSIESN